MTQGTVFYLALGWLFLVVGPLTWVLSRRLNKMAKATHPGKSFWFYLLPVSPELRASVKNDRIYQKLMWVIIFCVSVFFGLMFWAKSMNSP